MVEMSDLKKDIERMVKDLRRDMDSQFKDVDARFKHVDHRFDLVDKEFELVRKDIRRLEDGINTQFAMLRELLEPLRSIPERVARLEGRLEGATQPQSP